LYEDVIARIGPTATLIEWDSSLPAWPVLRGQARAAMQRMQRHRLLVTADINDEA
jgi:uncharacterized protein (UPF0276 family)